MPKQRGELSMAEFIRQSGLSEGKVRRMIASVELEARHDYKSVYVKTSELDKVKGAGK